MDEIRNISGRNIIESLVPVLFFLMLSGCGSASKIPDENDSGSSKMNADEIVFVVFKLQKKQPKNTVEILTTTKSTGKIKPETDRPISTGGSLTLEISQYSELIKTISIEHPLHKNVEYLDDDNKYKSKQVDLEEAEFFIRFQKRSGDAKIRVFETLKNNTKHELQTFTL